MLIDNGTLIKGILANKTATFTTTVFDGRKFYVATNRAARRFIRSSALLTLSTQHDLIIEIDTETGTHSVG